MQPHEARQHTTSKCPEFIPFNIPKVILIIGLLNGGWAVKVEDGRGDPSDSKMTSLPATTRCKSDLTLSSPSTSCETYHAHALA
jgi:hypothetical protein